MSKKTTVIVVAYPDCLVGNDPEPFFFFFYIFTVGIMRVMKNQQFSNNCDCCHND